MKLTDKIQESTDVSVRLKVCCKQAGFTTFQELLAVPKMELLKWRNFGRRTLGEVDDIREKFKK